MSVREDFLIRRVQFVVFMMPLINHTY